MKRIYDIIRTPKFGRKALGSLAAAALMFAVVHAPVAITASSATRQLPIYCVQRDQKLVSISFDAAWGNVRVRQREKPTI